MTPAKEKSEKTKKSEKDKGEKSVEQSFSGNNGKRKKFRVSGRGERFGRGRFSRQRPPRFG